GAIDRMLLVAPAGITACLPNPLSTLAYSALGAPGLHLFWRAATTRPNILSHLKEDIFADDTRAGGNDADARHWVARRPNAAYVERSRKAGLQNTTLWSVIPQIEQPVLLVWGRRASCPPVQDAE